MLSQPQIIDPQQVQASLLGEVPEQVFAVSEGLLDFHTVLENLQGLFGVEAGDDPERIGQAFAPAANQVDRDNPKIEDLAVDDGFSGSDKQLDGVAIGINQAHLR